MHDNDLLPIGWLACEFQDVVKSFKRGPFGSAIKKEYFVPKGYKVYEQKNAIYNDPTLGEYYISAEKYEELGAFRVKAGDFIVSCSGTIGKISQLPPSYQKGVINQALLRIRLNPELLDPKFFLHLFRSEGFQRKVLVETKGSAMKNIAGVKDLRPIPFFLPPLNEQKRIVAKIEALFAELEAGVASLELAQAQLQTYRQALLKHAFEGKLTAQWRTANADKLEDAATLLQRIQDERQARYEAETAVWKEEVKTWEANGKPGKKPSKPSPPKDLPPLTPTELADLPQLPAGWAWVKLVSIADLVGGVTKGKNLEGKEKISLPYLRVANVQDGYLDLSEIKYIDVEESDATKYQLEYGDVLYTEGGDKDKLGRGTIWQNQIASCIHQNHIFRARLPVKMINPEVIAFFSQTREAKNYFFKHGKQTTNLASINLTVLSNLPVPIQCGAEQNQLLQEIESFTSILDQLEQTITIALQQSEALRQSILKKAFAGQLVPQNPTDEPASALLARIRAAKS